MSQISIDLITPQGIVLENTVIPQDYTVHRIINELVENLNLPFFASGQKVEYALFWVNQNITLGPKETLADSGVTKGDKLRLTSSHPVTDVGPSVESNEIPTTPPSGKTIEVVLSVLDLNKVEKETFELDCTVGDVVKMIAKKFQLPSYDDLNVATIYYIKSKALGRILSGTETLRTAGIPQHDRLAVVRSEIAG